MNWTLLALLLCPLMMLPMMFFMMKGNNSSKHNHESHLAEELTELKKQNEVMQKELREIKGN